MIKRSIIFFLTILILVSSASAEKKAKKPPVAFGAYTERTLDMEVKVEGGSIKIWRVWEGGKRGWSINPQHEDLDVSEETAADQYGKLFAKEISRGLQIFTSSGATYLKGESSSGGGGEAMSADALPPSLSAHIMGMDVEYCTSGDNLMSELIVNNAQGNKWVSQSTREWAQYDANGLLLAFGLAGNKIGQVLYNEKLARGYADTNGTEVISYERDSEGRIHYVRDYSGRQVEYRYDSNGLLNLVIDADSNTTKYEYSGPEIETKVIGFGSPDADEQRLHFTYGPSGQVNSIFDDNDVGSIFTYEFDKKLQIYIKTEKQSGNRIIRTETDKKGRIKKVDKNGKTYFRVYQLCEDSVIVDNHNRRTYFDRDGIGRLIKMVFPDGSWIAFDHTLANWPELDKPWGDGVSKSWGIKSMTFSSGKKVEYLRNFDGKITDAFETLESGKTRKWKFTYDGKGNKASQRLFVGDDVNNTLDWYDQWQYDQYGNVLYYIDAKGNQWSYQNNSLGYITQVTEPNNAVWKFDYTPAGKIKYTESPTGHKVVVEYNKKGMPKRQLDTYDVGKVAETLFKYSKRGKLTEVIDPLQKQWRFAYDDSDDLRETIDPEGHTRNWEYDREGRVTGIIDGNNQKTTINYFDTALSGEAEQTDIPFPPRVQINYPTFTEEQQRDLKGRVVAIIKRGKGGTTETIKYEYDVHDRVTRAVQNDGRESLFKYDDLGRIVESSDTGWGTSTAEYRDQERKIIYHDPVGGTVEQSYNQLGQMTSEKRADGTLVKLEYDDVGNLKAIINANNQLSHYQYDASHQLKKFDVYSGPTISGLPAQSSTFEYNKRGDLLGYSDQNTSNTFALDALGRTLESITNYGPFQKTSRYTYLKNGLRDTRTNPEGEIFEYNWDGADNLQSIVSPEGTIAYEYTSTDWVQPKSLTFPGGAKQEFQYDDLRRYSRIISKDPGGNSLLDLTYGYKPNGQIASVQSGTGKAIFQYDTGARLIAADGDDYSENYSYDSIGRRLPGAHTENGGVKQADGISYQYDQDGNRIAEGQRKYSYNESGRLTKVESSPGNSIATYGYSATGERVWKDTGGAKTYFHYDEDGLAGEYNSSGNLIRGYLFDGIAPLRMKSATGINYFHTDHLGTPRLLTGQSGSVNWSATYSAFGKATIGINSEKNPIRFPGQYFDSETGLHQNGMRDYDPAVGAYLEQDPLGISTGFNLYQYVYGDPMTLVDPTGLISANQIVGGASIIAAGITIGVVAGFIAPAGLAVAAVITGLTTGFEILMCINKMHERACLYPYEIEECQNAAIGATLGVVMGVAGRVIRMLNISKIFSNPNILKNRSLDEVMKALDKTPGWVVDQMRHSRHGPGWMLREMNKRGNEFTGRLIQYHPGTHRHFDYSPYWKVSGIPGSGPVKVPVK